jgi:hypothetical protein
MLLCSSGIRLGAVSGQTIGVFWADQGTLDTAACSGRHNSSRIDDLSAAILLP